MPAITGDRARARSVSSLSTRSLRAASCPMECSSRICSPTGCIEPSAARISRIRFSRGCCHLLCRQAGRVVDGLKIWPEGSPLIERARASGKPTKRKPSTEGGINDVGLGFPYRAHKGTRRNGTLWITWPLVKQAYPKFNHNHYRKPVILDQRLRGMQPRAAACGR